MGKQERTLLLLHEVLVSVPLSLTHHFIFIFPFTGNSPQLIRRTNSGQRPPASVAIQSVRKASHDHTEEPCSPTSPLDKQSEATGSSPADKRVEEETDGLCEDVLPTTRPAQVCIHHETESEGMGSSVTSEDTITEETLQVWSKEVCSS